MKNTCAWRISRVLAVLAINGVAELHTELLKQHVLRDFYEFFPEKFSNKTNGVTPRRFMVLSNPRLADLITGRIGDGWITDLDQLRKLEALAEDEEFEPSGVASRGLTRPIWRKRC